MFQPMISNFDLPIPTETWPSTRADLERQTAVGVYRSPVAGYADDPPYSPSSRYPEYPFDDELPTRPNPAYESLRSLFALLRYDEQHFDMPEWNPLGFLIQPGMTVMLKPNMIRQRS